MARLSPNVAARTELCESSRFRKMKLRPNGPSSVLAVLKCMSFHSTVALMNQEESLKLNSGRILALINMCWISNPLSSQRLCTPGQHKKEATQTSLRLLRSGTVASDTLQADATS